TNLSGSKTEGGRRRDMRCVVSNPVAESVETALPPADVSETLQRTVLHGLHVALGAKLVPFAGYDMPVQYPDGIIAEHQHTRAQAGLFDVSHMGQIRLHGADAAKALEA